MDEKHGVFSIEQLGLDALKAQRRVYQEIARLQTADVSATLMTLNRIDERINQLERLANENRNHSDRQ